MMYMHARNIIGCFTYSLLIYYVHYTHITNYSLLYLSCCVLLNLLTNFKSR
jgi:hypothetical protein